MVLVQTLHDLRDKYIVNFLYFAIDQYFIVQTGRLIGVISRYY